MTSIAKESGRLAWLAAALSEHRSALADLLRRLTSFGPSSTMKASVFSKFLGTLEQIALEKEKETEIISRIQAIELQHRFQRKCKKLRPAQIDRNELQKTHHPQPTDEHENDRSNNGWLLLMGLICALSSRTLKPPD